MALTAPLTAAIIVANLNISRPVDPIQLGLDHFGDNAAPERVALLHAYGEDEETFGVAHTAYLDKLAETAILVCTATAPERMQPSDGPNDVVPLGVACRGIASLIRRERSARFETLEHWYGQLTGARRRFAVDIRKEGPVERIATGMGLDRPGYIYEVTDPERASIERAVNDGVMDAHSQGAEQRLEKVGFKVISGIVVPQISQENTAYLDAIAARSK
ncbi:MAG TPA: hypothetical protein VKQ34_04515 [Candidatus Saccharimonadales bacterium]|nr:hypothetical protein [Candidatus Saccharimonadales bacterium]